jgi:hypothetical protein
VGGQQFNVIKHAVISKQSILKVRLLKTGEDFLQNFEVIEKICVSERKKYIPYIITFKNLKVEIK